MGLWGRSSCPSASSSSRFLAAVGRGAVGGLRELFERDLGRNGVGVKRGIGMFDRAEDHYMMIDVDGTVSAALNSEILQIVPMLVEIFRHAILFSAPSTVSELHPALGHFRYPKHSLFNAHPDGLSDSDGRSSTPNNEFGGIEVFFECGDFCFYEA
jgi:hypothetical protein